MAVVTPKQRRASQKILTVTESTQSYGNRGAGGKKGEARVFKGGKKSPFIIWNES